MFEDINLDEALFQVGWLVLNDLDADKFTRFYDPAFDYLTKGP